jgi:hypothetical protein
MQRNLRDKKGILGAFFREESALIVPSSLQGYFYRKEVEVRFGTVAFDHRCINCARRAGTHEFQEIPMLTLRSPKIAVFDGP